MAKEILGERLTLNLKRFYPVAPEKVWRAWTDPKALGQWFRPDASFSIPAAEADVRVGGRFRILMLDAKDEAFDLTGVYREVVPGRKLVMTWGWKNQPTHEQGWNGALDKLESILKQNILKLTGESNGLR